MRITPLCAVLAFLGLPLAAVADRIHKQVPVTAGQMFEIDLKTGGSLTVHGIAGNIADVTVERDESDVAATEVVVEPTSGGVRLATSFVGKRTPSSWSLRIEVRLPQRFNVQMHSAGGAVHLDGLEGDFKGLSMGGKLDLVNLRGVADLKTLGGDIHVSNSRLSGAVSTNGGNVILDGVEGGLHGHTLGGQVTYRNMRSGKQPAEGSATGPLVISSTGGQVRVDEAPNGAELKTMGGNVLVHSANKFVKALTMGGDILIKRVDGRVDATTMEGDITVTVTGHGPPGSHAVRLNSSWGVLRLAVPANLPMDIDVQLFYTRDSRRNYHVHSDFPLKLQESAEWDTSHGWPRKVIHATGRLGAATQRIELRTTNGDVYITAAK